MFQNILLVAAGALLGGTLRFLTIHYSRFIVRGSDFPWGTLTVNLVGCLIAGYVLTWTSDLVHDRSRLLIVTGFCGGLTTFSTFAYESMDYWHQGKIGYFLMNFLLTNCLCMVAIVVGVRLHNLRG